MPTLNWIGKDAVVNHHLQVPFHLLKDVPELACGEPGRPHRFNRRRDPGQTSKDWFYPDFVCQLTDGRILVVEYKGKHLYDGIDAEAKRAVGAVWAARSGSRCLFVMPTDGEFAVIAEAVKKLE